MSLPTEKRKNRKIFSRHRFWWKSNGRRDEVSSTTPPKPQCISPTMLTEERIVDTQPRRISLDWNALRGKSLEPGGFGEDRVDIWPKLLNVSPEKALKVNQDAKLDVPKVETSPHQDERQIGLDTDRSFVLYPVDPKQDREALQSSLNELLISLFRKRPRLSYFQGYHDIATVLFLTLPAEMHLACVEKLSLHRLRDSMGSGLEPVLGLLRVTKHLLKLADSDYEKTLEQSSPLPFYALSNLLTLFSHDMPTLPLIQHVFDYLLCRPPIAVVYLTAATIMSRKEEVIWLEAEGEEGMIHSLLSSLPSLTDGVPEMAGMEEKYSAWNKHGTTSDGSDSNRTFFKTEDALGPQPLPSTLETSAHPATLHLKIEVDEQDLEQDLSSLNATNVNLDFCDGCSYAASLPPADRDDCDPENSAETLRLGPDGFFRTDGGGSASLAIGKCIPPKGAGAEEDRTSGSRSPPRHPEIPAAAAVYASTDAKAAEASPAGALAINTLPAPAKLEVDCPQLGDHDAEPADKGSRLPLSNVDEEADPDADPSARRPQLVLTDLLKRADELYEMYPPSHSALALSSIMGPQSVVFTWSESPSALPSDNTAEAMVQHPELVVYPYVEPTDSDKESYYSSSEKGGRREGAKGKGKENETGGASKRRGPRRHRLRKSPFGYMEKRTTVVAGTVLVVGVAVAVYGMRARNAGAGADAGGAFGLGGSHGGSLGLGLGLGLFHGHAVPLSAKEWRRLGGRVGGALVGMSEKLMNGLSSGA